MGLYFRETSFVKIKSSRNCKITLSFIDIGKSCLSREFFTSLICLLMLFAKIKFSRKFPNLHYHTLTRIYEHFANLMLKHLSMIYIVYVSRCGAHCGLASGHVFETFQPANGIVPLSACQQNAIYVQMACNYQPASKTPFTCKRRVTNSMSAKRQLHANGVPFTCKWRAIYVQMACHLHANGVHLTACQQNAIYM